jgi:site-specific recombinase XerD
MSCIRQQLTTIGVSQKSAEIIMASWRKGTKSQYKTYINKWSQFCSTSNCDFFDPQITKIVDFLTDLFHSGLSYSAINSARSALSALCQTNNNTIPFGQHPLVKRFMKGIFELRPSFPRYKSIWDVNIVFNHLRNQPIVHKLTLKDLTIQVTFLLLFLSGKRCQTIHLLNLDNMNLSIDKCEFVIREKVKQTRVGHHIEPIMFEAYPDEPSLCIITHLKKYLERTKTLRSPHCNKLLISFTKPHHGVSRETISRWCKTLLSSAGINTKEFGSHSTRSASTSYAAHKLGDITQILESVGWSNATTFQTFYNKPIRSTFNLGSAILNSSASN